MNKNGKNYASKTIKNTRVNVKLHKKTVCITLSSELIKRARKHKLNISRITEQALVSIIDYLETQNQQRSSDFLGILSFPKKVEWAGPDLNRRPSARQADVLAELDDRPYSHFRMVFWYLSFSFSSDPKNVTVNIPKTLDSFSHNA